MEIDNRPIVMVRPDPRNCESFSLYKELLHAKRNRPPFQVIPEDVLLREAGKYKCSNVEIILIRGARLTLSSILRYQRLLKTICPNAMLLVDKGSNDELGRQLDRARIFGANDQITILSTVEEQIKHVRAKKLNTDPFFQQGD